MSDLSQAFDSFTNAMINAANVAIAADTSKKDRKFAEKMYNKQVEDNRKNWEMQNEYNKPSAQMKRLAEAGLNPNLVYGTGAVGNSASVPAGSSLPSYHSTMVPQFQAMQLGQMYLQNKALRTEIEGKELDNDNKRLAYLQESERQPYYKEMAENEKLLKDYEVLSTRLKYWDNDIDYQMKNIKYQLHLYLAGQMPDYAASDPAEWERTMEDLKRTPLGQQIMAEYGSEPAKVKKLYKEIDILTEELKLYPDKLRKLGAEAAYEELKVELARNGINITDPLYVRIIGRVLNELFPEGVVGKAAEGVKSAVSTVLDWLF